MKKKQLEKDIPRYAAYPFKSKKKKYAVVVRKKNNQLVLDFFFKKKKKLIMKVVVGKKEYGTYLYDEKKWNTRIIENNVFTNESTTAITEASCEILEKHVDRIKNYKPKNNPYGSWFMTIESYQHDVNWQKRKRKYELRQERLDARSLAVGEEPPEGMGEWMRGQMGKYIFYKKKGRYATCKCGECGDSFTYAWKSSESYEGSFEKMMEEPAAWKIITCPHCGEEVICRQAGKTKSVIDVKHGYAFKRIGEKEVVLRYFEFEKRSYPDEGVNTIGAMTELARVFFYENKKVQIDYQKYNPYSEKDYWDDCNLYGMANISIEKGAVYEPSESEVIGTVLQYSAYKEYARLTFGEGNILHYFRTYLEHQEVELLVKLGLIEMVKNYSPNLLELDLSKKKVNEILKIRKERMDFLKKHRGNVKLHELLVAECEGNIKISESQLLFLKKTNIGGEKLQRISECMSITKFINRSYRYAEVDREKCFISKTPSVVYQKAGYYADMLSMLFDVEADTTSYPNLFPKDLKKKHDELAVILNEMATEVLCKKRNKEYPNIKERYEELSKIYTYKKNGLVIRPVMSAGEIVREGQFLHICVGGTGYLSKHNKGKSIILVLRKVGEEDVPYVTVEVNGSEIEQWQGMNHGKPDKKQNDKWLEGWRKFVKRKMLENEKLMAAG